MISKLKKEIEKHDIISFDIFDTLVKRKNEDPESIFDLIGIIKNKENFKQIRKEIQTKAFQTMNQNGLGEITLEGIYNELDDSDKNELMNLEEELELELIYLNEEIIEVFNYAKSLKKRIILISDMYLTSDFFMRLFIKLNLVGFEEIFVSSDLNSTKRDTGELFVLVCKKLQINPSSILHIGDNYVSDYERALAKGLNAFHYSINKISCSTLSQSIIIGTQEYYNQKESKSIFKDFGQNVGILCFYPFFKWLDVEVPKNKVDLVLFVARDGYLLNKFWAKYSKSNVKSEYLYGSRVLYALASINEKNFDNKIEFLAGGCNLLSIHEVFERIGVSVPSLDIIKKAGFENRDSIFVSSKDYNNLLLLISLSKKKILKKCFKIRHNLFQYFLSIGITNNKKIMFVDVGWSGTTQYYFEPLIKDMFDNVDIVGNYYGLINDKKLEDRKSNMNMNSYLSDEALLELADKNRVLIELCFSAPHPSIISIDKEDEEFILEFDIEKGTTTDFKSIITEVNLGIELVFKYLINFENKYNTDFKTDDINSMMSEFLLSPGIKFIEEIGKINNFDTWSSTKNYSTYFALSDKIKKKTPNDRYNMWLNGYQIINRQNKDV